MCTPVDPTVEQAAPVPLLAEGAQGLAGIYTTSEVRECLSIAHRIIVMRRSRVSAEFTSNVSKEKTMAALGEAMVAGGEATISTTTKPRLDIATLLPEGRAFFALIAIIIVLSMLSPYYFTRSNFLIIARHVAIYGLPAIGMLLVILNGGIDVSVGSTFGLSGWWPAI